MAKTKNKKKNLAESASQKKNRDSKKKTNPFEVHINKDKQKVLGRKSKNDRGLPGIARSKAINKRKNTLLHEFMQKDKDNLFMDKRIGERNLTMSQEEKALARYAAEKMREHKKKNIFSLNDEEVLTHRGQTLEEIEKFDDPRSDDEFSDDDKKGHLDKKFVSGAHFGGGLLSKSNGQLSGKELIANIIAESKKRKAEQQNTREKTIELTNKLDSEWKDLVAIMTSADKVMDKPTKKPKTDDYDKAVRELQFESRGNPSDRLKSEKDIMEEEKKKLEELEQDRLARMKGFVDDANDKLKHKSADDLDDGFIVENINEEPLAYDKDGIVKGGNLVSKNTPAVESNNEDDCSEATSEKDSECEETEENADEDDSDNDDENDDNDDDEDVDLDDLKESESSSDEEQEEIISNENLKESSITIEQSDEPKKFILGDQLDDDEIKLKRIKEIREDLQRRKDMMEKARQELPYTYNAPENYDQLKKLLKNQNSEYQSIILERIIKCNHWSLNQGNREKLCKVFEYLLQYIVESCTGLYKKENIRKSFIVIDRLCPHLFDLAQANAQNTATCVQTIMKEKHENFKNNQKKYPGLDTLILFKIVSLLFPTSDFRHPVVTPSLVFMSQILLRCRVKSRANISKGLFIVTLMLEYTLLSKRFVPSAINFLRGIIYLATVKPLPLLPKVVPPFKRIGEFSNLLILEENQKSREIELKDAHMTACDLAAGEIDEDFKVRVILTTINLIDEFRSQLEELEAAYSIFEPIVKLLKIKSWTNYPKNVRKHIKEVYQNLQNLANKKLEYMVCEKKKPKALRLYEPRIEKVYDGKKFKPMSKEKAEREKLINKIKKERKGAIREIRRDTAFLAKVQIKQQLRNDEERESKLKKLLAEAAEQQGELNKLNRMK